VILIKYIFKIEMRKGDIQKALLQTVAVAGLLGVAVLAPNMLKVLKQYGFIPSSRFKGVVNTSRKRLVTSGLLKYKNGNLQLTKSGEAKLRELEMSDFKIKIPKRWDGKWRVLIFDISERRRGIRDKVRRTLVSIGSVHLQDSVWVYPYDCEDLVTLLKADFKIGRDLLYMIVDSIENDKCLRESFDLM
jgi:DNA-binding transcriptional regulator PaaX